MAASGSTQNNTSNHHNGKTSLLERSELLSLFPLKSISDVVKVFRYQLEHPDPDLTLLSILAGFIEISLTTRPTVDAGANTFPTVTFETIEKLYTKFQTILSIVEKPKSARYANRAVIKKVSDIIWHSLIRSSYKDRAHLQHLYSYLSSNKLDCFGVAMAVVAGCQLLGYKDVHLAISEDHAWVIFGVQHQRVETIEVTWHGKGNEDKRGQEIATDSRTWLYLSGHPVVCNRFMEVAAIVSAINIALTSNSDCVELADLQQNLLWMLYDLKHLDKYPMSLGNLGELEEISPKMGRPTCEELYREAIKSARKYYDNHHVYPYTYQGGYYYRRQNYREAFASWANAGDVIRLYNYSRDDEEIYKEFMDIANETIPHIMKSESSGHSARSILRDSECFANLLRFYDGICQWEEGSLTPILHIGWAKPLVNTISKFDYDIRSQVIINCANDDEETSVSTKQKEQTEAKQEREKDKIAFKEATENEAVLHEIDEGNNNSIKSSEMKNFDGIGNKKSDIPTLADLTAACGEKILNPDFLLQGGGQLFAEHKQKKSMYEKGILTHGSNDSSTKTSPAESIDDSTVTDDIEKNNATKTDGADLLKKDNEMKSVKLEQQQNDEYICVKKNPVITLYSHKMKGLKDLLIAEKLNTHAISLQVTAQSQVAGKKVRGTNTNVTTTSVSDNKHNISAHNTSLTEAVDQSVNNSRPKRTRRE